MSEENKGLPVFEFPDEAGPQYGLFRDEVLVKALYVNEPFYYGGANYDDGGVVLFDQGGRKKAMKVEDFEEKYAAVPPAKV